FGLADNRFRCGTKRPHPIVGVFMTRFRRVHFVYLVLALLVAGAGLGVRSLRAEADAMKLWPDRGAAGMARLLRAIRTRASLASIVAHADDEDGGMLSLETRGTGARAIQLTLNRGEGGQNEMSSEVYDALGLIRTEELLVAGRYYGVDQYFTSVVDYGFSKT